MKSIPVKYNDRVFRWVMAFTGAYFLTEFGNEEGYFSFSRLLTREFYIEFGSSLVIALTLIELIAWLTRVLDRRYDWQEQTIIRICAQVTLCIVLPVLVDFLMASIYFWLFDVNIFDTIYLKYAMPLIAALLTMFNVYYLAHYFAKVRPEVTEISNALSAPYAPNVLVDAEPDESIEQDKMQGFMVNRGKDNCFIPIADICYFFLEDKTTCLYTFEKDTWAVDLSLRAVETRISNDDFFRLNRQLLVHRKTIKKFVRLRDGRLNVMLRPRLPVQLTSTVSQKKAVRFQKWLDC